MLQSESHVAQLGRIISRWIQITGRKLWVLLILSTLSVTTFVAVLILVSVRPLLITQLTNVVYMIHSKTVKIATVIGPSINHGHTDVRLHRTSETPSLS